MDLESMIQAGDLDAALALAKDKTRDNPADSKYRILLFQLFCIQGEWDRALNQLKVLGDLDAGTLAMVNTYKQILRCEMERQEVFEGARSPVVFGQPDEWVALLIESLKLLAQGKVQQADQLRAKAFEDAPMTSGSLDGQDFQWIADADSRMGPMLEAMVNGKYYWVPFHQIASITIENPEDLRDFVWLPARFSWVNEGQAYGFIPTRYINTDRLGDDQDKMARKTEWQGIGENAYAGIGQRLLATDGGDSALLNVRELVFTPAQG
jgi:type VI secretion system protein ImpE